MIPDGEFWLVLAGCGAVGIGLFIAAVRNWRRAQAMRGTPTSRVRSAAQGYVELEGRAELLDGPAIICPLTAHRCVWWHYRIQKKVKSGRNTRWRTVDSGTSDDLFALDDATGRCVIDPVGAKVTPGRRYTWYGHTPRPTRGPKSGAGGWLGMLTGGHYKYEERLIEVGSPCYAIGAFRTQRHAGSNREDDIRAILTDWKQDQEQLLARFDVNNDGHIDDREWQAARRVAAMQADRQRREQAAEPGLNVMARPADGQPFLLAGVGQDGLIRRYHWQGLGCAAGFLVAVGVFAWLLETRGII
ncbi:GIDE domain-containing protein [Spectribacter hydrogenooxidans]|uniref:RING-type E3 ubiquitin transferase n=1 Tax=Spectribacter hydrogenoxidans TaxID=3075608 RepID=A0ABU3C455_9GAMM|nr:GIDE domain-containing protein [Salinisphaera sp. W335]MDT0636315.1 GIDE domain-containing protein [Salinisphaera sp. W335]